MILFGPETLSDYKHNLVAITSSLLVGVFGFFLTGELGLKINTKLLDNKIGKIALQASGGVALFILTMIWWRSPMSPIEKVQDNIIEEQKKSTSKTINTIDSSTTHLNKAITQDGEKTRETVLDASIAELEGIFPLAVRIDRDVDGTIIHFNGEEQLPLISFDRGNGTDAMKLRWGDRLHYYLFFNDAGEEKNNGRLILKLSNGYNLPLELTSHENEIRIPGSNPNEITAKFYNPDRLAGFSAKITVYSSDRERGRELFKEALMNTALSSRARQIYKQLSRDGVRLREGPSNDARVLRTLKEGTYVKILKDTLDFMLIRLPEGRNGWVKSEFISKID